MEQHNRDNFNTILIIDDDFVNRKILAKIFSDMYEIREAANGSAGLSEILTNRQKFCAIFLDVVMPGMNGIEVLRHLKKMKIPEKIPIFLITAEYEDEMAREAYRLGVMDVIIKPVVSYVVRRRVKSVVELFATRERLHTVIDNQNTELLKQAERISELNRGMIEALATAIEFRNEESGEHVNRIYFITKFMLENTEFGENLSKEEINNIAVASIMHDVGKIAIPDAVLAKPGRLTKEEFEVMKTHTTQGVVLLERISQLRESAMFDYACDIARHHHERWDGRGYPDHLVENEISPWAQIVSLADVYDALSSKRVYKKAFSRNKVLEMIWAGECGVFNPQLLDSFFAVEEQISGIYKEEA
ncbi:MAG: response regulator [Lachnospiraceae bacterium]|jgi:putative two-component system response regulator|nr:response regulator [Lachnospiraceae bacterium]